tara:strand:- start:179 stop:478 length:300 start_codon:yes stop_codon:yes gene_type:complete
MCGIHGIWYHNRYGGGVAKMKHDQVWIDLCDFLIESSENDPELKSGLTWLDKKFGNNAENSIYDIMWEVLMTSGISFPGEMEKDDRMIDFMKNLTRKKK